MSDVWPEDMSLPVLATSECPMCSMVVPDARYCGACGADLVVGGAGGAQRLHSYAAFPDEPVVRLSIVTSLFPHLSHRAKVPFRVALGLIIGLLIVFSLADAVAPLMALCSLGVPLLFLLYVFEVDPYEGTFVTPTVIAFVLGAGLGAGWALIGRPYVDRALLPSANASLTSSKALVAAIVVPVIAQVLMCVPIIAIRVLRGDPRESLDGFVAGATSAVGFTLAATVVLLSPWLSRGQLISQPFMSNLSAAVVRGMTFPLVSALVTGLIGAAIWGTMAPQSSARGRWVTSPVVAIVLAVAIQVGSAFSNLAALPDATLLVVQLGIVIVGIVLMRVGLHHVLVHEAKRETVGPPRICADCSHLVPAMAFCPECGVAERAIERARRAHHRHPLDPPAVVRGLGPPGAGAGT